MDSLIIGLLITNLVLLLVLVAIGVVCISLCYKTLVRPEAPCYAGGMQPKFGMMSVDPSHPAYAALAKKIGASTEKVPNADGGNYL